MMTPRKTPLRLEILGYLSNSSKKNEGPEKRTLRSINKYMNKKIKYEGSLQDLQDEINIFIEKDFIKSENNPTGEAAYQLSTDGKLLHEEWDIKTYQIEIDMKKMPLNVEIPSTIDVFISCGGKPQEEVIAKWLNDILKKTDNINPFWWREKSPSFKENMTYAQRLLKKAEDCDAVIVILHFRDPSSDEPALFPLGSYDEIGKAHNARVPIIVFRQPEIPIKGMILPNVETPSVTYVSEIWNRLNSFLLEAWRYKQEKGESPHPSHEKKITEYLEKKIGEIISPYQVELHISSTFSEQDYGHLVSQIRSKIEDFKQTNAFVTKNQAISTYHWNFHGRIRGKEKQNKKDYTASYHIWSKPEGTYDKFTKSIIIYYEE